jgi:anti-repressor protein
MEHLIKITSSEKGQTISAKELYEFLDITTDFTTWCKRMFEYGFEEDIDFTPILGESTGGRPSMDYALTLDAGKEISMLQRSDKGKTARKYFIECEKELRTTKPKQLSRKELAYMVIEAEEKSERLQLEIDTKHKPRSEFVDLLFNSDDLFTMSQAAKLLGLDYGRNTLFKKLRERGLLFKNSNEPRQEYVKSGIFEIKEKHFNDKVNLQTYVTHKGLAYIAKMFNVIITHPNKVKVLSI